MDDRLLPETTGQLLQMPAPALPSSPQTLLQRLDQLDKRLKEIEEKQRVFRKSYFSAYSLSNAASTKFDQESQSLGSSVKDVDSKGTLMDRLLILETRIVKLNNELGRGSITSSSSKDLEAIRWVQPGENRAQDAPSSERSARAADRHGERLQRGLHQPSEQKSKKLQVKESKESIHAEEKKSRCCHKNNRWVRSRWFAIGC